MKLSLTIILCYTLQFTFAQPVDNYAKNKKLSDDEDVRFENERKTNKDSAEVYWKHANTLAAFTFNAYKSAGKYYERALSIDSTKIIYFMDYANYLHQKLKNDDKARQVYNRALKLFPKDKELQKSLDNLHESQTDSNSIKIKENFKETGMYYSPKSPIAQIMYAEGEVLFKNGDYKKSIRCYLKALEIEPEFIDAMDNLGNSYRYINKFDSAEYWYNKSINLFPKGFIAHQNLAIVYLSTSRVENAMSEYDMLTKLDPENPEGYFGKANTYVQLGKGEEVVANAKKARELYKRNNDEYERDAVYMIGIGYYLQKDMNSAKIYLKEAKEKGVDIPDALQKVLK